MSGARPSDRMRIGAVLRSGRERAGLDITEVEEQTKIRIKYLRALEAEEWDALPSPAYAKGFLRTYAGLLGLDAEAMVDELRRELEAGSEAPGGFAGHQPPEARRRRAPSAPGPKPPPTFPPIFWLVAALIVIVAVLFAALGLLGDGGGDEPSPRETRQERQAERRAEQRAQERRAEQRRRQQADELTSVGVTAETDVAICLVTASGEVLLDGGVLSAGAEEGPFDAASFELRFPDGFDPEQLELTLDGEPAELTDATGPVEFSLGPGGELAGPEPYDGSCP